MTDSDFIGYCNIHCETERALFSVADVNRMLALAGHPPGFASSLSGTGFVSVHQDMKELCKLARARQADAPAGTSNSAQIIPFPSAR